MGAAAAGPSMVRAAPRVGARLAGLWCPALMRRTVLFFTYDAGLSELIGNWLVIFGLLTPLGALALSGTMTVAAYQHISTAGLNIYVLELVLLYLGGSLALLFNGPGRFSFDAGIVPALLDDLSADNDSNPEAASPADALQLPVLVERNFSNQA
jgi:uncharacterized membrane protein YphA (DoxX/SURF4 family)